MMCLKSWNGVLVMRWKDVICQLGELQCKQLGSRGTRSHLNNPSRQPTKTPPSTITYTTRHYIVLYQTNGILVRKRFIRPLKLLSQNMSPKSNSFFSLHGRKWIFKTSPLRGKKDRAWKKTSYSLWHIRKVSETSTRRRSLRGRSVHSRNQEWTKRNSDRNEAL